MKSTNEWILDIPDNVNKEWLIQYKEDLYSDAELCKMYDFHSEILEAITVIIKMIEEKSCLRK